jgi:hypothetical protein
MPSLEALNDWLQAQCLARWHELRHSELRDRNIAQVRQGEVPHLMALPVSFDGFVEQTKRVTPTCLIQVERNRYANGQHRRKLALRLAQRIKAAHTKHACLQEHSR